MSALASVLPFLASLKKQIPDASLGLGDTGDPSASFIGNNENPLINPNGSIRDPGASPASAPTPTPPPGPIAQQPVSQLPDVGTGEPQAAPEDKGNAFRQPYETKGHALMRILQSGVQGALSGLSANASTYAATGRNAGFGGGAAAGYTQALPMQAAFQRLGLQKAGLENEQLIQMLPFLRAQQIAGLNVKTSEAQKNIAEAGKAGAEAGAIPVETALKQAQTEAAYYKDDPMQGLIDIRTKQPVTDGTYPLTPQEAAVVGKNPGDMANFKVKEMASQLVERLNSPAMADSRYRDIAQKISSGQQLSQGDATFKAAYERQKTLVPQFNFNLQNAGATGTGGQPSAIAQAIANGSMKWQDAVSPRTPMSVKTALLSEVKGLNPNFNSGDFDVEKQAKITATSGSVGQQLLAIGTAREHMKLFKQLSDALDNGDLQLANKIGNYFSVQFGSDKVTNQQLAAQAFGGEVGKAFDGAGVVAKEREDAQNRMAPYLSKGQFKGAAQVADQLLAGKQKAAHDWFDQAVQAKPDFGQTQNQPASAGVKVGDKVTLKNGQTITVKAVHADGSFD